MWTLASNMAAEWTPRTVLRTETEPPAAVPDDPASGFRDGIPTPLMQVILDALAPFAEARRAVADALSRLLPPDRGRPS